MKNFKITPNYIFTVLAVLILSIFFAATLLNAYEKPALSVTFFTEQGAGPVFNALYFTGLMSLAGFLIYILIRFGRVKSLKIFLGAIYILLIFTLFAVYIPAWLWLAGFTELYQNLFFILPLNLGAVIALVYTGFIFKGKARIIGMGVVSSALGSLLGFFISTLSAVAILLALSAYDVFAVWKGPVGKIASRPEVDILWTLVVPIGEVKIGLGDLVFYSMLTAHTYAFFNLLSSVAAVSGILIGIYLTLRMLRKRTMFPGLPLSLGLGLAFSIGVYYLSTLS